MPFIRFSNNELTKNILRDDNSLLCRRRSETEEWKAGMSERLPEGKYERLNLFRSRFI